jgi:hypothetical protein
MESTQLLHPSSECLLQISDFTGSKVDVLEQAGPTTGEVDLEADVSIDSLAECIDLSFIEPDVTTLDTKDQRIPDFLRSKFPPMRINVDTPLDPRKISSTSSDKLKYVRVLKIKMTYNSSILIDASAPQDFIQG